MKNKWYTDNSNNTFYTNFPKQEKKRFYVGDGSKNSTPKDFFDKLNLIDIEEKRANALNQVDMNWFYDGVFAVNVTDFSKYVELPCGAYNYGATAYPLPERLIPASFRSDEYIRLDQVTEELTNEINNFVKNEDIYRRLNTIYKYGILLYGPPGEGKTSLIRDLVRNCFIDNSVIINVPAIKEFISIEFINHIKETLADKLKIFIFEEVANFVSDKSEIEAFLNFMDGEMSIDKSIIFATTNYPEILPKNVVDRPSRFDKLYKVGSPNVGDRKKLLTHFLMRSPTDEEVEKTGKMSTAYIKEACLLTHKRQIGLLESIKLMESQSKLATKNFSTAEKIGI